MILGYPAFLLVPCFIALLWLLVRRPSSAAPFPDLTDLSNQPASLRVLLRRPLFILCSGAALALLAIAASDPQTQHQLRQDYKSRNLMIALDLSKSMSFADFASSKGRLSRIMAVKEVTLDFLASRPMDRIGIAIFGSAAYLQSPLTLDHDLLRDMVSRLNVGVAGDATAIGDGLGVCLKRIADIPSESRAIILITDGVNNSGQVNPIKAAHVAKEIGVKIHTIGVGSTMHSDYDEDTLKEIANITGGTFFNASDYQGLQRVYEEIDRLEQIQTKQPLFVQVERYFPPFALAGLVFYLAYILLFQTVFLKTP